MFGLTTQRRKRADVAKMTISALNVAQALEWMLNKHGDWIIDRLKANQAVEVSKAFGAKEIWPSIGARFNEQELESLGIMLSNNFSAWIFPARIVVVQHRNGSLRATIKPADK